MNVRVGNFKKILEIIGIDCEKEEQTFLLITCYFYWLLATFACYLLLFACHLLRFTRYSSLITFYLPLATNYLLFATFYDLLVTLYFHSPLLIRWSLHFTRCFCALISTIYLLSFRN